MSTQSARWIASARLLRRIGFGATGPAIDVVARQDWSAYLDAVLNTDPDADPGARATPMPVAANVPDYPGDDASKAAKDEWNKQVDDAMWELALWWPRRMAAVREPIHEKLTLLWHNHFATSATKVRFVTYMGPQNQKLRTLKLGNFRDLAFAMLTDAAMLSWLDGGDNVASSPNENLAREFMELFALGHGNGYTEADVRAGARSLTGWTVDHNGRTSVAAQKRDTNTKTVLGVTGNLDAAGFCDAVLSQPHSPEFVAGKLWRQLASDAPASPATLGRLVAAYGPGRDLKALTKAILLDPDFTGATSINTPVEWLIGVIRTLHFSIESSDLATTANDLLKTLGQRPFYPPDVGGWPIGRAWVSTASVAAQLTAAYGLATHSDLSTIEHAPKADRIDAVGYLIGVGAWSDRSVAALKSFVDQPPELFTAAVNTPEYLTS